jgi:hypothetical protein
LYLSLVSRECKKTVTKKNSPLQYLTTWEVPVEG